MRDNFFTKVNMTSFEVHTKKEIVTSTVGWREWYSRTNIFRLSERDKHIEETF